MHSSPPNEVVTVLFRSLKIAGDRTNAMSTREGLPSKDIKVALVSVQLLSDRRV